MAFPLHRIYARGEMPAAALTLVLICTASFADASRSIELSAASQLSRGRVKALAAGKCLVAARDLPDPNFSDSVVLLVEYGETGAMGVIVNRPTELLISRVLGDSKAAQGRTDRVFFGGPVSPKGLVALVRSKSAVPDSRRVLEDVHLVTSRESLEGLIRAGTRSSELRTYLGYAGWGPGQLERETAAGSWHILPADADVVFDPEPEALWRRLFRATERLIASRLYGAVA
jgi:putative transcriptional regulator